MEELDYGNRVAAIHKAIEHLNQGCTVNYVVDGLREWYGITMDPGELKDLLLQSKDLLPEDECKKNIDKCLLTLEKPDDGKKIFSINTNWATITSTIYTEKTYPLTAAAIYAPLYIFRQCVIYVRTGKKLTNISKI